jgi:hypothetical protein
MITIRAAPRLRADLPGLAGGRALVIDYFASARCGMAVGDITADFGPQPPAATHVKLANLEGVPVFAERRLVSLLEQAGPSLDLRRLPFGRRLQVNLERPEQWLEFLERPGIVRHRRFPTRGGQT